MKKGMNFCVAMNSFIVIVIEPEIQYDLDNSIYVKMSSEKCW